MTPTLEIPKLTDSESSRFFSKVDVRSDPDSCWLWLGAKTKKGHGLFRLRGRLMKSHRVAFVLGGGILKPGQLVIHGPCNNSGCCRYDHLSAGTYKMNAEDRKRDGTNNDGARNGKSKMTTLLVISIRESYADGRSQASLAKEHNLDDSAIHRIVRRKNWKHI